MVKWFVTFIFQHFGNLSHKVLSPCLSAFIYFGPRVFHFCRSAQIIPAFKAIVKVTKNYVCTFGLIMEFGTALLLDRTQILQNDHIYIIQFCVLNPFQTTQDTIKLLELPTSQFCHALATQCS